MKIGIVKCTICKNSICVTLDDIKNRSAFVMCRFCNNVFRLTEDSVFSMIQRLKKSVKSEAIK